MGLEDATKQIEKFKGISLADRISDLEKTIENEKVEGVRRLIQEQNLDRYFLSAASAVKRASAQIDVVIHAVGIIYSLPYILDKDEHIVRASIGASSASGEYDLETDRRLAEFKFSKWQGSGDAVRKKTLFEDFVKLAIAETSKEKYLYILDSSVPIRFLRGNSFVLRLLDRNNGVREKFIAAFGDKYQKVNEFHSAFENEIKLVDLIGLVPGIEVLAR